MNVKSRLLVTAAVAVSLLATAGTGNIAYAQQNKMPPVYGILDERGLELQLNTLQTRIVNVTLDWVTDLYDFNYQAMQENMSLPFHLEDEIYRDPQQLASAFRQWYVLNQLDGYREQHWVVEKVLLIPMPEWLADPNGKGDQAVADALGVSRDGYMMMVRLNHPTNELQSELPTFYLRMNGTKPEIAGIWNYNPAKYQ